MYRARLAKIKQSQAANLSKRGHGLGRKFCHCRINTASANECLQVMIIMSRHSPIPPEYIPCATLAGVCRSSGNLSSPCLACFFLSNIYQIAIEFLSFSLVSPGVAADDMMYSTKRGVGTVFHSG